MEPNSSASKFYLAAGKPLLLMDDFKIFLDSPRIQVLVGTGLELKGIMLEVLDSVLKEHLIGVVNRLNPFLGEEIFKIYR